MLIKVTVFHISKKTIFLDRVGQNFYYRSECQLTITKILLFLAKILLI